MLNVTSTLAAWVANAGATARMVGGAAKVVFTGCFAGLEAGAFVAFAFFGIIKKFKWVKEIDDYWWHKGVHFHSIKKGCFPPKKGEKHPLQLAGTFSILQVLF
jgi:hypothetical protein